MIANERDSNERKRERANLFCFDIVFFGFDEKKTRLHICTEKHGQEFAICCSWMFTGCSDTRRYLARDVVAFAFVKSRKSITECVQNGIAWFLRYYRKQSMKRTMLELK